MVVHNFLDQIGGNFDDSNHDEVEEDSDCYHYHAPVDDYDYHNYSGNAYDEDGEDDGAKAG